MEVGNNEEILRNAALTHTSRSGWWLRCTAAQAETFQATSPPPFFSQPTTYPSGNPVASAFETDRKSNPSPPPPLHPSGSEPPGLDYCDSLLTTPAPSTNCQNDPFAVCQRKSLLCTKHSRRFPSLGVLPRIRNTPQLPALLS